MSLDLSGLIVEVDRRHRDALAPKLGVGSQRFPRASSIGECAREIYHSIVDREHMPAHEPSLIDRFEMGSEVERIVTRRLNSEGWNLSHQQVDFEITEPFKAESIIICNGHYDGRIEWQGHGVVYEIKSLNPNVWARIDSFDDFKRMGGFWTKYVHQLLIYLYKYSEEAGVLILHDCLGHMKMIPVYLMDHLDECERALQIARAAAIGVATKTPPEYHKNPAVCQKCWARVAGVCTPPMDFSGEGVQIIDDPELAEAMETCEQTEAAANDYAAAEKRIKEQFKARGAGSYIVGDFMANTKVIASTTHDIPKEVKEQYKKPTSMTKTTWERITDAGDDGKSNPSNP